MGDNNDRDNNIGQQTDTISFIYNILRLSQANRYQ